MSVSLLISRNGGSAMSVDIPAVNGKPPVTYKYSLESDDLSAYTSAYSTSINLPKTHTNCKAFNFPDNVGYGAVNTVDAFTYTYTVDDDPSNIFQDVGKAVISSVTETININLFSTLAEFNTALSNSAWPTSGAYKNYSGTTSSITYDSLFQPVLIALAASDIAVKYIKTDFWDGVEVGEFEDTSGDRCDLAELGMIDVGKPADTSSELGTPVFAIGGYSYMDGSESIGDVTWTQVPAIPITTPGAGGAFQLRWYWLRFFLPALTLLRNIQVPGYTLSFSAVARQRLSSYSIIGPKLGDLTDTYGSSATGYSIKDYTYPSYFGKFHFCDVLAKLDEPYNIVKMICKSLNLRFKRISNTEYQICSTQEFYDGLNPTDISSLIDYSTYSVTPHAYKYSHIIFEGEGLDTFNLQAYKDKTDKEFNRGKYTTGYSVKKDKNWFSDSYKYACGYPNKYVQYPWMSEEYHYTTNIDSIVAYDDSWDEVDVTGCLVHLANLTWHAFILGDSTAAQGSFEPYDGYYAVTKSSYAGLRDYLRVGDSEYIRIYTAPCLVYGEPEYKVTGQVLDNVYSKYFGDVNDSLSSSLLTTNVVFPVSYTSIDAVVRKLYWFENNYWVIWSIDSFVPGGKEPCEVTFLKVNDLSKYQDSRAQFTYHVTVDHGTVTATVDDTAVADPSSFTALEGQFVDIRVTSASGYAITSETFNGITSSIPRTDHIIRGGTAFMDYTLQVNTTALYHVTATAGSGGSVSPTSEWYEPGTDITLTAVPDTDYRVYQWTDNGTVITTADTTYTISSIAADHVISVAFVSDVCQLTGQVYDSSSSTAGQGGTISTDGQTYSTTISVAGHYGDEVTIYQRPASNYRWDHWETTGGVYISSESTLKITLTEAAYSVRACFWNQSTSSYALITTSGEGVANTTGFGNYSAGTSVTVDCTLESGYSWDTSAGSGWYDGSTIVSQLQQYSFSMPANNLTLQARASSSGAHTYTLRGTNCTVTPSTFTLSAGETRQVTVTPSSGYEFSYWSPDMSETQNRTFRYADAPGTYTAVCEVPQAHTYTFSTIGGGTVDYSEWTAYKDDTKVVTATPLNSSYRFVRWDDDTATTPVYPAARTFTMTNRSKAFTAVFEKYQATLSFVSGDATHGQVSRSSYTGQVGSTVSVTASTTSAGTNYDFDHWSPSTGCSSPTSATATFEVLTTDDVTYTAYFTKARTTLTFASVAHCHFESPQGTTITSITGAVGSESAYVYVVTDNHYYVQGNDYDHSAESTHKFTFGVTDTTVTYVIREESQDTIYFDTVDGGGYFVDTSTSVTVDRFTGYEDDSITIRATADTDYEFDSWPDLTGSAATNPVRTLYIGYANIYRAKFNKVKSTYTFNATGGSCSPSSGSYNIGSTVTATVTPSSGYTFIKWNDNNYENPRTFTVGSVDNTYTATCTNTHWVHTRVNDSSYGTISGAGDYLPGETVTITATASSGHSFLYIRNYGTGVIVSYASTYTFTMGSENITFEAFFS